LFLDLIEERQRKGKIFSVETRNFDQETLSTREREREKKKTLQSDRRGRFLTCTPCTTRGRRSWTARTRSRSRIRSRIGSRRPNPDEEEEEEEEEDNTVK
jgi:hypothetical protein